MNLLDNEYIHIGNDKIYTELWHNIMMDENYLITKPYGGLWTSPKNSYMLCDWLSYIKDDKPEYYDYISQKPYCTIKFKNNSKLLKIETENDYNNLIQSNMIKKYSNPITINKYFYSYNIDSIPDYEKISNYYDLIYINPYLNISLKSFSVNTMLAIKDKAIEYYIPNNTNIKKHITNPSKDYILYYSQIEKLFNETNLTKEKLKHIKEKILSNKNNLYKNNKYNINEEINEINLLNTITTNIYIKKLKKLKNKDN